MSSGNLSVYLGSGDIGDRPATPDIPAGMTALWYADDTSTLSAYTTVSGWEDVTGGSGGGAYTEEVITTSSQSTASFTSISQDYRSITLRIYGQAANSGTGTEAIYCKFNSDAGANYYNQYLLAADTSISGARITAGSSLFLGNIPQSSNAIQFGQINVEINAYTRTVGPAVIRSTGSYYTTGVNLLDVSGLWNSTSAITRIDVSIGSGSFTVGSRIEMILNP